MQIHHHQEILAQPDPELDPILGAHSSQTETR